MLRLIWAIPAAIILMILAIGMGIILIIAWFAIVITGRLNRGFYDFMLRVSRMSLSLTAYLLLMTDNYPRYDGVTPTSALRRVTSTATTAAAPSCRLPAAATRCRHRPARPPADDAHDAIWSLCVSLSDLVTQR